MDNIKTVNQLGHTNTINYDVLNRRTTTVDALNGVVTLAWDPNNNLVSLTDPVGNQTQWQNDALNRKTQETDPLFNRGTMAYDAIDRLTSATDKMGQLIACSYDILNRQTGETWYNAGGTQSQLLTFTFDANDNLLSAANSAGIVTNTFDALDRLASAQDVFGTRTTYTRDAADNNTVTADSFGGVMTRTFDSLNRATTMQFGRLARQIGQQTARVVAKMAYRLGLFEKPLERPQKSGEIRPKGLNLFRGHEIPSQVQEGILPASAEYMAALQD